MKSEASDGDVVNSHSLFIRFDKGMYNISS